ncbi:MAG: peroxiredoxin family protein [Actinomycetota bacterium]|nr:peroxiredoxin family protein [Actinomycetota bacterium]
MTAVFWISFGALWIIVAFQTLVILGLTRTLHTRTDTTQPESAPDTLERGKPAPDFSAVDLSGAPISLRDLVGRPAALLFVSPNCEQCSVTLDELNALELKARGTVLIFCRSSQGRCAQLAETYGLRVPVIVDEGFEFSRLFHVAGAPTAVLLRADGTIEGYGIPGGASDLEESMRDAGWAEETEQTAAIANGHLVAPSAERS